MKKFIRYISTFFWALALALVVCEFIPAVKWAFLHLGTYQWMLYGFLGYLIVRKIPSYAKNEDWMQVFTHELSHTLMGLLFFQKIHHFQAGENEGYIQRSGTRFGDLFIGLAPYCIPIYTITLFIIRIVVANAMLPIFDVFIGITIAFHFICAIKQISPRQPDISERGKIRSFIFIATFWFFNGTLILLSIRKGILGAIPYLFPLYWKDIVSVFS